MNPFDNTLPKNKLFRLTGGPAVSDEIAEELVNFLTTGQKWCDEFIQECKIRPEPLRSPLLGRNSGILEVDL